MIDRFIDWLLLVNTRLVERYRTTKSTMLAVFVVLPVLLLSTFTLWLGTQYYQFTNWIKRKK